MARGLASKAAHDFAGNIGQSRRTRVSDDLYVTKAMEREHRPEGFDAPRSSQSEIIRRVGVAQILAVDAAVGIEDLSEAQPYRRSSFAYGVQRNPPDHVLAHVEDM